MEGISKNYKYQGSYAVIGLGISQLDNLEECHPAGNPVDFFIATHY